MSNHLIIGLGGTGGKIIRSLRKTIYNEYRSKNPTDVNIGYIYADTSDEMMDIADPSWRVLGNSVQLAENSKVFLKPIDLVNVINDVQKYPGIRDWIGNTDDWKEYLNAVSGLKTAGGQRRRLGRFIMASNVPKFQKTLGAQINQIQSKSGSQEVTFHICAGLAGGTGAGTLIDVIAQIRKSYRATLDGSYLIYLYLMLPEAHPKPERDTGFYHSNGYATLLELNALGVGSYMPIDISHDNPSTDSRFKELSDPFNGVYLFSNINENGNIIDIDTEAPTVISDLLFQKIISVQNPEWYTNTLKRAENHENHDPSAEKNPETNEAERSVRFQTFGIKKLSIPEQEIQEYITYNFAKQSVLQLRYNNWSDEIGYRNEQVNQNFNEIIANKKTHENWKTTDEHFQLSLPIIDEPTSKKWKKIGDTWRFLIPEFKSISKEKKDANWLDELKKLCDKQYAEQFRNLGVKQFYEAKNKDRKDLALEIVKKVEDELFSEWQNGHKSLFDIKRFIETLVTNIEDRLSQIDDKIIRNQQNEEKELASVKENEKTWSNIGTLAAVFLDKKTKLLDGQATVLESLYIYKTMDDALRFSKILMRETLELLNNLKESINIANQKLDESITEFDKNINSRINDDDSKLNGQEVFKQQVIRFYDPERIKRITKDFIRDSRINKTQASVVRSTIISKLGDSPNFQVFNDRISKATLINELEKTCSDNSKNAEADLQHNNRIFNIGIVDRLKQKYQGNSDALGMYLKNLMDFAGVYLSFNQNERNKTGSGAVTPALIKTISIIIPSSEENAAFIDELKGAFNAVCPPGVIPKFIPINDTNKKYDITILTIVNGFPLRCVELVNTLREKYDNRIRQEDSEKAKMFLHTENISNKLPRLFIPTQAEIEAENKEFQQKSIPLIILGYCFGLIIIKSDNAGYEKFALVQKDKNFDSHNVVFFMDKKISESHKHITKSYYNILEKLVVPVFKNDFTHKDNKAELGSKIIDFIKIIKEERGAEDIIYNEYKKDASILIDKIK